MRIAGAYKFFCVVFLVLVLLITHVCFVTAQTSARLCYHFTSVFTDDSVVLIIDNQKIFDGKAKTKQLGGLDFAFEQCLDTQKGKQHNVEILINGKKTKQTITVRENLWVLVNQSEDKSRTKFTFTTKKPMYD